VLKKGRVDDGGANLEATGQFLRPLLAQAGRTEDHRALAPPSLLQLRQDQGRLNRLAQAHFIRNQQPRGQAAHDGQRRLELKREDVD
jgi:hypothetical protein